MNNESKPNNVFGKTPSLLVVVMWFTHTGKSGLAQQTAVSVRGVSSAERLSQRGIRHSRVWIRFRARVDLFGLSSKM